MSEKKDLVVKMTINSTDFDNGLKNAKSQMKQTEGIAGSAGASMKKAFGAVALAVGGAATVMEGFKKLMRSTEEGADAMDRALHVAKTTTDQFLHSIASGNFDNFIKGLDDITANAKAAYEALDALGTMKMWGTAEISNLQAKIAEDKVIVNNKKASEEERKSAQSRIDANIKEIENITGGILEKTQISMKSTLREIAGAGKMVSDEMLLSFRQMFQDETLGAEAEKFYAQHAKKGVKAIDVSDFQTGSDVIEKEIDIFDTEQNRQIYAAMKNLSTINEEQWNSYYELMKEESALRTDLASQLDKANKLLNKETGGSSGGSGGSGGSGKITKKELTIEQLTEYYTRQMERVPMPLMPYQEYDIPTEDIIEPETDMIVESVTKKMAELVKQTAEAITMFNALGSAFSAIGNLAGDNMFGNIASGLGSIVSQASQTVTAMMALAGAETIEGLAETFANAPIFTKVALTATALAGVLSVISTVKNAFAGSFADGGIVGGNSYSGDRLWARVNSGEMILNRSQQASLMNGGNVKFVIEGSQLKGVLDNYESIQNM